MGLRNIAAAFEGFDEGNFIGIFQIYTDWDTVSDPRDSYTGGFDETGEVNSRRFAINRRIGGDNNLLRLAQLQPIEEGLRFDLGRPRPSRGERLPTRTWYKPLYSPVRSMANNVLASSTTRIRVRSRIGSVQKRQTSSSDILLHHWQNRRRSLTSKTA